MSDKPEHPPALGSWHHCDGITVLDLMAFQSLGELSSRWDPEHADRIAAGCYDIAEAMLAERQKRMARTTNHRRK